MNINDQLLDRYGVYFVYHEIHARYGYTFMEFVERNLRGTWVA